MDSASVDRPVSPRPKLAKTIGVLNVLFGLPLFFCGLVLLQPVAPTLAQFEVLTYEPESWQYMYEQQRSMLIERLKAQEAALKDESAKQAIRQQRIEFENKDAKIADQLDQKVVNRGLERFTWYLWADILTGAILNLLMLASGIGVFQLHEWARRMAIWVASLKIVRLIFLAIFFLAVVVTPLSKFCLAVMNTDLGKVLVASGYQAEGNSPAPGVPAASSFEAQLLAFSTISTIFFTFVAILYPTISLILLTRPSTRVACEEASAALVDDSSNEDSY
ncbi:hypothetical protein [Singulisphaera sp. PoT]|uniref:hypothetical protein n=1 Tax=Singulisphaera sp. PoT TaxID=3411797 RepID=UPI003BF4C4F7